MHKPLIALLAFLIVFHPLTAHASPPAQPQSAPLVQGEAQALGEGQAHGELQAPRAGPQPRGIEQATRPPQTRGIYLQQYTAQSPKRLEHLIDNALDVGVDTFVVDLWSRQKGYVKGIERIRERGLEYVPRITMFPDGGNRQQVNSRALWEARWRLAEYAIELGAKQIQLDYIRYSSKTAASPQNALDIREVLRFFKKRANERGALLQIDVFGEVSHGPSLHIGQDMRLFASEIDAVCPMVYPSHYEPYEEHARQPFETVHGSLTSIRRQMGDAQVPVLAYIELFNYRFKLTPEQRVQYIREQLRAVEEAGVEGWIAWSAGNHYDVLFDVLRRPSDDREVTQAEPSATAAAGVALRVTSPAGEFHVPQ